MRKHNAFKLMAVLVVVGVPMILTHPVFASDGNVTQVETFIKSVIKLISGLAGLIATVFFVVGGITYMTSSGNPERLDHAKRTLFYSAIGLAITIGAFVLSSIVTDLATSAFGK